MSDDKYILTSRDVTKRFGGLTAVNKMSVNIERGRIFSIIGPNGAGKTTFFNAISGLYHCDEGAIEFEGKRIETLHPYQVTDLRMARTFQNIRLFGGMTVVENIMVGAYTRLKQNPLQAVFKTRAFREEEAQAEPVLRNVWFTVPDGSEPPGPPVAAIVSELPAGVIVTFEPCASVTAPVSPLTLSTTPRGE